VTDKDNEQTSEEVTVETTSVFRADFLNELDAPAAAGGEGTVSGVEGLPVGSALLVVKRGPNAGSRFLLDQVSTSAGRHPDSDIFLDDVTVSRRHAEFRLETNEFQVVDVGSLNGTYVNREPVDSAVLANGDEVQIGKFRLVFIAGPRPEGEGGGA
jgi:pSer/pThr/pTyr-binding forkhead associated (FHA) protein